MADGNGLVVAILTKDNLVLLRRNFRAELRRRIGDRARALPAGSVADPVALYEAAEDELLAELDGYARTLPKPAGPSP